MVKTKTREIAHMFYVEHKTIEEIIKKTNKGRDYINYVIFVAQELYKKQIKTPFVEVHKR